MRTKHTVLIVAVAIVLFPFSLVPFGAAQSNYQNDLNKRIEEQRVVFDTFTFTVDYTDQLTYDAMLSVILAEINSTHVKVAPYVLLFTKEDTFLDRGVQLDYDLNSSYDSTKIEAWGSFLDEYAYSANPVNKLEMPSFNVSKSVLPLTITFVLNYTIHDYHYEPLINEQGVTTHTFIFTGINQDVVFLSVVAIGVAILYVITVVLIIRKKKGPSESFGSSKSYKYKPQKII